MSIRNVCLSLFVGLALASAPALASANSLCRSSARAVCDCCQRSQESGGCRMQCHNAPAARPSALSADTQRLASSFAPAHAGTSGALTSHQTADGPGCGTTAAERLDDPPSRLYLHYCTFRL